MDLFEFYLKMNNWENKIKAAKSKGLNPPEFMRDKTPRSVREEDLIRLGFKKAGE